VRFLNTRAFGKDSNLVSCGGNGWVRFWDVVAAKLVAEFVASLQVSSIIMEVDQSETYLATGDVNGHVKIWNISDYCIGVNPNAPLTAVGRKFLVVT
jgi:WD repeat-containing protein 49